MSKLARIACWVGFLGFLASGLYARDSRSCQRECQNSSGKVQCMGATSAVCVCSPTGTFGGSCRPAGTVHARRSGPGDWGPWLDRDNPGGRGDYETVRDFLATGQVPNCPAALEIDCQTTDGRDWRDAGQPYSCEPERGGICLNDAQRGRQCYDYRIRFRCADPGSPALIAYTCDSKSGTCECEGLKDCTDMAGSLDCGPHGTKCDEKTNTCTCDWAKHPPTE